MASFPLIFLCGCAVVLFAAPARTIKCYQCFYTSDGCTDEISPTTNITQVDCDGSCLKLKTGDGIIRTCSAIGKFDFCQENGDDAFCVCDTDLCNGNDPIADTLRTCAPYKAHSAQTIKCYYCVPDEDSPCPTDVMPIANVPQVECKGSCVKIISGDDVVIRTCSPIGKFDFCKEIGDDAVCLCDKDLCNGNDLEADSQRTCGSEDSAQTIECYQCGGSDSDIPCPKRFSPDRVPKVDCDGSCFKIDSENGVVYGCNPHGKIDLCKENEDGDDVCMCDTNLCNGKDPVSSSTSSGNKSAVAFSIAAISSLAFIAALITRM